MAVSASHRTARGASIEVCEETDGHSFFHNEAGTFRGAAVISGTTHKTVKRVIARHEAGAVAARLPRTRSSNAVAELVAARVKASSGRISAKRLLPAAQAAGYAGSARNFRRLVAECGSRHGGPSITMASSRRSGRRVSTW